MTDTYTNEDALYVRKELGTALQPSPDTVKIKAMAPDHAADRNGSSHWVSVPVAIFRQMISAVRGDDEDKPFPHNFMGGRVIMAARIPIKAGLTRHQGLIIREYEEDGQTLYSVHYLVANRNTDPWEGDDGSYDIATREEAFDEFTERMYRRGNLSRDRK
jgi:hypothetical protein